MTTVIDKPLSTIEQMFMNRGKTHFSNVIDLQLLFKKDENKMRWMYSHFVPGLPNTNFRNHHFFFQKSGEKLRAF